MKHTNRQTTRRTLTDLYRAIDHRQAVTITYTDRHGVTEIRTVEIHEVGTTSNGDITLTVMCRLRGAQRDLRVSRISEYTVHRMAYVMTRPEPKVFERPEPAPTDDADALFFYELARDPDDADYRPRHHLSQTDTDLAA